MSDGGRSRSTPTVPGTQARHASSHTETRRSSSRCWCINGRPVWFHFPPCISSSSSSSSQVSPSSLCPWRSERIVEKRSRFLCHVDDRGAEEGAGGGGGETDSASSSVCVCVLRNAARLRARDRTRGGRAAPHTHSRGRRPASPPTGRTPRCRRWRGWAETSRGRSPSGCCPWKPGPSAPWSSAPETWREDDTVREEHGVGPGRRTRDASLCEHGVEEEGKGNGKERE